MVDITEIVTGITNKRVSELAKQIRDEMKAEIAYSGGKSHIKTGNAYNSIQISYKHGFNTGAEGSFRGGFLTYVAIGSDEPSAYYLNNGNGGSDKVITAKHKKANGKPGALGEYPNGIPGIGWRTSVHGYDGIDFVGKVADRHR